jgi:hypothetical protein
MDPEFKASPGYIANLNKTKEKPVYFINTK